MTAPDAFDLSEFEPPDWNELADALDFADLPPIDMDALAAHLDLDTEPESHL